MWYGDIEAPSADPSAGPWRGLQRRAIFARLRLKYLSPDLMKLAGEVPVGADDGQTEIPHSMIAHSPLTLDP